MPAAVLGSRAVSCALLAAHVELTATCQLFPPWDQGLLVIPVVAAPV